MGISDYTILIKALCSVSAQCTNPCVNGECIGVDTCECQPGWTGDQCDSGKYVYSPRPHLDY